MSETIWDVVRDALRYRELRKHVNRGYPQPGIPFVSDWARDDDETLTGETYYTRERELDDAMDKVLDDQNKWDDIATLEAKIIEAIRNEK